MSLFSNYKKMFKSKGFRLVIIFFLEVHIYDIFHGLDTSLLEKSNKNTVPYMASWTSTNKLVFNKIKKIEKNYRKFAFIDVGVGKGKAIHMATQHLKNIQIYYGIDNDLRNIEICRSNLKKSKNVQISLQDAREFNLPSIGNYDFIVYFYNPFEEEIFIDFFEINKRYIKYLILVNNQYSLDSIKKDGFSLVFQSSGWHVNKNVIIMSRD